MGLSWQTVPGSAAWKKHPKILFQQCCNEWLCSPYKGGCTRSKHHFALLKIPPSLHHCLQGVFQDGQTLTGHGRREVILSCWEKGVWNRSEQEILEGGRCPCPWQGGWNRMIFKTPSNSISILWIYDVFTLVKHLATTFGAGLCLKGEAASAWIKQNCSQHSLLSRSFPALIKTNPFRPGFPGDRWPAGTDTGTDTPQHSALTHLEGTSLLSNAKI